MTDTCKICGKELAACETIWAAKGKLFCSRTCGVATLGEQFDDVAEEINPVDIGLVRESNSTLTSGQWRIATILCRRDDCTFAEAKYRIESCIQQMEECNYNPVESEEILYEHLGLEPDYLMDLLLF